MLKVRFIVMVFHQYVQIEQTVNSKHALLKVRFIVIILHQYVQIEQTISSKHALFLEIAVNLDLYLITQRNKHDIIRSYRVFRWLVKIISNRIFCLTEVTGMQRKIPLTDVYRAI